MLLPQLSERPDTQVQRLIFTLANSDWRANDIKAYRLRFAPFATVLHNDKRLGLSCYVDYKVFLSVKLDASDW